MSSSQPRMALKHRRAGRASQDPNSPSPDGRGADTNATKRVPEGPTAEDSTGRRGTQARKGEEEAPTTDYANGPRPGFDEYGQELGKSARFWKAYVRESKVWDADMVDGWNNFVIESSKTLRPDPAETTAQTVTIISQTLFAMANTQPGSAFNFTPPKLSPFVAPTSAVCVNALWFLSLSLSVAVSLIAMLGKDWARGYIAELTGQPYQQARKRQQRWDALREWNMPEVIMFLPSLLHLALQASNFEPAQSPDTTPQREDDNMMDTLTSRALAWLIANYEDIRSMDIALQVIAGADIHLPTQPLVECGAPDLLVQRLETCYATLQRTGKQYLKDDNLVEAAALYGRAIGVMKRNYSQEGIFSAGDYHNFEDSWAKSTISLLGSHIDGRILLESSVLLGLLKAVAYALADFDFTNPNPLVLALVQMLSTLDARHVSPAHGMIGVALTSFSVLKSKHATPKLHSDHRRAGLATCRHYELHPPLTDTDGASLVLFGLLSLIHCDTPDSIIVAITQTLRYFHPRPDRLRIFGFPEQTPSSYLADTIVPHITPRSDGSFMNSETLRAAYLSAVNGSFLSNLTAPEKVKIYCLALENLLLASSNRLKQLCCDWSLEFYYLGHLLSPVILRDLSPVLRLLLRGLDGCNDDRVLPYIMSAIWKITRSVLGSDIPATEQHSILQPALEYAKRRATPDRPPQFVHEVGYVELWLSRLENMQGAALLHVWRTRILAELSSAFLDDPNYAEKFRSKVLVVERRCLALLESGNKLVPW
ncbi:hypothetical protein FRC06_001574 [Ceratobasidium sp. 370]|nr:hypothetical protein FRC06_001574 [Ceratobasidium sp. 370]